MSTLRATNIKNPDSGSNNIVLDSGGGVVISGVTTASSFVGNITGNVTGNITGNATGNFTISSGNLIVGSGYGIDFSAASNAAGMTSELLSDFEVGTFTPTITNDGFTRTYNSTYTAGRYTKIGNTVHVEVHIYVSGQSGTNNGNFPLINLPFAATDIAPSCRWNHNICRLVYVPQAQIAKLVCVHLTTNNPGYIELTYANDGSSTSTDSPVNTSTWFGGSGNYQVGFSCVYKTSS